MSFPEQHDLHKRRFGRNVGLGLALMGLIVVIFSLTIAKVESDGELTRTDHSASRPIQVEN